MVIQWPCCICNAAYQPYPPVNFQDIQRSDLSVWVLERQKLPMATHLQALMMSTISSEDILRKWVWTCSHEDCACSDMDAIKMPSVMRACFEVDVLLTPVLNVAKQGNIAGDSAWSSNGLGSVLQFAGLILQSNFQDIHN
ncbi:hypothetical protein M513_02618 [Trichuris suis]|uniref:Uncharacterized protein n=1 Tax=Trichuris suis TaxID=68888 RepID=A0A085MH18_9BILA|nr:hypothetical protein M513_02618 [Trichuris suis]